MLDLRHLAKGMYLVRLSNATGTGIQRITLE
jgi:hypothetical protein